MSVSSIECERARRSVSLAADGEISHLEHASLQGHLSRCPACTAFALEISAVTGLLRDSPLEEPARPVFAPQGRDRALLRRRVIQASAAAAAVVAALGLGRLAGALTAPSGAPRAAGPSAIASTQEPYVEQTMLALLSRPGEKPRGRTQAV